MKNNNTRGLINRGDDPYPVDVKAEAVALACETGNLSEAARQMKDRYPDRHPSRQLITRWFKQTDPESFAALSLEKKEAFQDGIIELADKAREKLFDALDDMTPVQIPIPAGIAIDKGLKLLEIESRGSSPSGFTRVLALIEKIEKEMMADGSEKISETRAAIMKEGEMP